MLSPSSTKYSKYHKLSLFGKTHSRLVFGTYGIQAVTGGRISASQIEAARRVLSRVLKKEGPIWIRIFPDHPLTRKPSEVRMGKGKGSVYLWYAPVKADGILFEFTHVELPVALLLHKVVSSKLPIKTRLLKKP